MSNASSDPSPISDSRGPIDRWKTNLRTKPNKASVSKPKRFGSPLRVILFTVGIFIFSQLIATGIVAVQVQSTGGSLTDSLNNSSPAQFIYTLFAEAIAIAFVFQILRHRKIALSEIGLVRPKWNHIWKGLLGFVIFYIILAFISQVVLNYLPEVDTNQVQDVGFNTITTHLDTLLALISLVILPPIGEEILVRGYLYSGLRARWRFASAALVTSVIFGFAHLQLGSGAPPLWAAAIDTFTLSLVLTYLREKTGALYAGMVVHSLNNLIAFFAHFHSALF